MRAKIRNLWIPAALAALTIVAFAVRLQGLQRGLWIDEHATAWVVRDGFAEAWERAWVNNNSPAYFLIARLSANIWGYTEAGLRIPSLLAGTLLVPLAYLLARRLLVPRLLAVTASALVAFDSSCLFFSVEARPYALVQLVSALQIWTYLVLLDERTVLGGATRVLCSVASGVLLAATVYLHPLAVLLAIPEVVYVAYLVVHERRDPAILNRIAAVVVAWGIGGALCIPLLNHLRYLSGSKTVLGSWVVDRPPYHPFVSFNMNRYVYLPMAVALVVDYIAVRWRRTAPSPDESLSTEAPSGTKRMLFPCLLLFVPAWTSWSLTATNVARIYVTRYLAFAAVAPIMIAMTCCASLKTRSAKLVALGVMIGLLHFTGERCLLKAINGTLSHFRGTREWCDARPIVECINSAWNDSRPVLVQASLAERQWLIDGTSDVIREYLLSPVNSICPIKAAPENSEGVVPIDFREQATLLPHLDAIFNTGGFILATPKKVTDAEIRSIVSGILKARGLDEEACDIEIERPHRKVLSVRIKC